MPYTYKDNYVLTTNLAWIGGGPVTTQLQNQSFFIDGSGTYSLNESTASYYDSTDDGYIDDWSGVNNATDTVNVVGFTGTDTLAYAMHLTSGYTIHLSDGSTLDPATFGNLYLRILEEPSPGANYPMFFDFTDDQLESLASQGLTIEGITFGDTVTSDFSAHSFTAYEFNSSQTYTDQFLLLTNLTYDGSGPIVDQLASVTFDVNGLATGGDYIAETTISYYTDNDSDGLIRDSFDEVTPIARTPETLYIQDSATLTGTTSSLQTTYGVTGYTITLTDGTTFTDAQFGQLPVRVMSDGTVWIDFANDRLATLSQNYPIASITFADSATIKEYPNYTGYGRVFFEDGYAPLCVTRGTMIRTTSGEAPVEELKAGDLVATYANGAQEIRWVGSTVYTAEDFARDERLCPIRVTAGALGAGLPKRDLLVSRQHRLLVSSRVAERMFGQREVLIAAIHLTEIPGIYVEKDLDEVEYHHVLLNNHEVLFAEDAPSESLLTGDEAVKTLTANSKRAPRVVIERLIGRRHEHSSFLIPKARQQRKLVERLLQNGNLVIDDRDDYPVAV